MRTTRDPPALCWRADSLKEFQSIYADVFGETLEGDDLEHAARYLLNIYVSIYGNPQKVINPDLTENHYEDTHT